MVRIQGGAIDYDQMPGATVTQTVTLSSPIVLNPLTPTVYVSTVIARPQGGVHVKGAIMTGPAYATVCQRAVSLQKFFHIAKTLVSSQQDVMYKLVWDVTDISIEVFVPAKTPLPDWYPYNYEPYIQGNGVTTLKLQARTPPGGTNATCQAELVGEEV